MVRSVLEALEEDYMNIDMDTWDPEVAKAMPFKPHNRELHHAECRAQRGSSSSRSPFS